MCDYAEGPRGRKEKMTNCSFREDITRLLDEYSKTSLTTYEDCYEAKETIDSVVGEIIYMIASKFAKFELERAKEKK
jgi:hypothetical protein